MVPKDKDTITQKSGVIYRFKCTQVVCEVEYTGELGRTFGHRLKKHLGDPFPIYQHGQSSGNYINLDSFPIVAREAHGNTRTIKEVMFIRSMIHPLTGNLASSNSPTSWIRPCKTPLLSILSNAYYPFSTMGPYPPHHIIRGHIHFSH